MCILYIHTEALLFKRLRNVFKDAACLPYFLTSEIQEKIVLAGGRHCAEEEGPPSLASTNNAVWPELLL